MVYTGGMQPFSEMLAAGGKSNSLGRVSEVIELVLEDKSRLEELYSCLFEEDAWVRMRAADALEKVCRQHPDWLKPYINKFLQELSQSTQPSIQWHLAQIFGEVELTDSQRASVITWLKSLLSTTHVDWIVSANSMETLMKFATEGFISKSEIISLLELQQQHESKSVVRRATKLLEQLRSN